ncbi:MAG: DUF211 domain-containing protein [Thermoplasmata archaeon]
MGQIIRLELDVLKPHQPSIVEVSRRLSDLRGISGVTCVVEEVDQETESVRITIEGEDIDFDIIQATIDEIGGAIHSVDLVSAGTRVVKTRKEYEPDVDDD